MRFKAKFKDGRLWFFNKAFAEEYLTGLMGKVLSVTITVYRETRSNAQNNYYWGVVIKMLCDSTGQDKWSMHHNLKDKFAKTPDLNADIFKEADLFVVESTADMSTARFSKYKEDIQQWASEFLGVNIPDPNEEI